MPVEAMIYWEITAGFANWNTLTCKRTAEQAWRVAERIYFVFPDLIRVIAEVCRLDG